MDLALKYIFCSLPPSQNNMLDILKGSEGGGEGGKDRELSWEGGHMTKLKVLTLSSYKM